MNLKTIKKIITSIIAFFAFLLFILSYSTAASAIEDLNKKGKVDHVDALISEQKEIYAEYESIYIEAKSKMNSANKTAEALRNYRETLFIQP